MIPSKHLDVLRQVQERLRDSGVIWVITGSLGLALQGVETDVHDIDVQSDRAGAHQIEELFADYVVRPVALLEDERVRSHLGALEIDGPWEPPPDLARLATTVEAEGTQVPVLRLEYERDAYRKMGRPDKAELIAAALRRRL